MKREAVLVSIVGLRSVSFEICDSYTQSRRDPLQDFGLGIALPALDSRQVAVIDLGDFGESAQAVPLLFALSPNFRSVGLHKKNDTQRDPTKQEDA
jgi:hypothetical protein